MTEVDAFLDALSSRLAGSGFVVRREVELSPYQLDLIAAKSSFEISKFGKMTRFVLGTRAATPGASMVQDFSAKATKYALDNRGSLLPRGLGGSMLAFPVVVSEEVDESLGKWVEETFAPEHWAAFEFPVLVSTGRRRVYYCKRTPIWGAAYYRGFRKFAESYIRF
ncbi:MAG: hypothetical protein ABR867_02375 [Nitrososphaerales archaeon]|jgi:hypothetical protein